MRPSVFTWIVLFVTLAAAPLQAGPKLTGAWRWQAINDGASIAISTTLITNPNKEDATGTMQVQLWATPLPYVGGTIEGGRLIGSYKLEGMKAGQYYANQTKVVDYVGPPVKGSYYVTLVLTEFRSGAYVIADWHNTPAPFVLGPLKTFTLTAPWAWQTSYEGGTVDISVAKITHHKKTRTGSLKLSAWAFPKPYQGQTMNGFELGNVVKDGLEPGYTYSNVKNTAKLTPPPAGTYYVVIMLSEFGQDKIYHMVDYINSSTPSTFHAVGK